MYRPTVSNKQKIVLKKNFFCWHLDSHWRKEQGTVFFYGTDPNQNVTDLEHCLEHYLRFQSQFLP
jgi:hypothetical protein